ncbi:type IV pilus twitching motility protein PilT [Candidatus Parcubacteria bacterium]|nr:type IV pilus twitching motility protein PilT [Patescibacteria group bacterium]MBU4309873.1 type IV pilus twitching motility protein PilT [Patescibacteria group bacterium]MBU4431716.1 type IV pilus twitching motility protein PilT [Patescibacteria group bacterium]MBU4578212.1 type IV pilus twitching motility protein PilT [Patescibacteria group bacterium]MCG2696748.1 type IV pilus twitching motility protein PilT [Candidatus Parcubacteria bacterium]
MTIKELLKKACDEGASDLHILVNLPPALRINGELKFIEGLKEITVKEMDDMLDALVSPEEKKKFIAEKELDVSYDQDDFRFRVNFHFEKNRVGLVARVISTNIPSMEDLALPKVVYSLLDVKQGLILVTGPTGCGKSTTMASMVNHINLNKFCNIITLEDPIEYLFFAKKSLIMQRQLGRDMLTFSSGLSHALRQDPDVIMVGEMRDLETIGTAITLAETGHLVFATLHTYNAAQTVDRIIDIFPPHQQNQIRAQLSMTLVGVVSQRLLQKIDGGRVAAREIMINNPAISNIIRENKVTQMRTVIETSSREGMVSLDQDIKRLYVEKRISKEEARSYMDNPEILDRIKLF